MSAAQGKIAVQLFFGALPVFVVGLALLIIGLVLRIRR
jgi:hypothetical protein